MSDQREPNDELRDAALSRLYAESSREVPPARLDEAILSAARKAVEDSPSTPRRTPPKLNWHALAAVAAVMLIALLLVPVLLEEEQLARHQPVSDEAASPAGNAVGTAAPATAPAPKSLAEPAARSMAVPMQQPLERLEQESADFADRETGQAGRASGALTAPAPEFSKREASRADSLAPLPLDVWQDEIRRLMNEGEQARALEELTVLRRTYPDARIDPVLLRQLGVDPTGAGVQTEPAAVE